METSEEGIRQLRLAKALLRAHMKRSVGEATPRRWRELARWKAELDERYTEALRRQTQSRP